MNKHILIIIIFIIGILLGSFMLFKPKAIAPIVEKSNSPVVEKEICQHENLCVEYPKAGQVVSGTILLKGKARKWYFEASFPVRLIDASGKEVLAVPVQAQGEWMTVEFVPFETTITIPASAVKGNAMLVFTEDNPAGDEERGRPVESVSIPIIIK